jgi:hypothetical protein
LSLVLRGGLASFSESLREDCLFWSRLILATPGTLDSLQIVIENLVGDSGNAC